jgi:isoquinoline 1-oxidoreductase beta subunit
MGKWTRRAFIGSGIIAGGALVVGVAIRPGNRNSRVAGLVGSDNETVVTAWVKIGADNAVTAIVPHAEMGQGAHSSLAMMLADELDADWTTVSVLEAPAHEEYANHYLAKGFALGEASIPRALVGTVDGAFLKITQSMDLQITGGSTSVRLTGQYGMRVAGAAARAILLEAAAEAWEVPVAELSAAKSVISHKPSQRKALYADFAQAAALLTPPYKPRLKSPEEFTIIGRSLPRLDIPAKTDGSALFGIDATLPGMKYAAIKASPVFGGKVVAYSEAALSGMPGVQKVVNLDSAVAVVADSYWQAQRALDSLAIQFDGGGLETVEQSEIFAQFARDMDKAIEAGEQQEDVRLGNTSAALAGATRIVEAEYRVPYLAHATMEPMNCTAWVHDGMCEVWTSSQNPLGFRAAVAEALGIEKSRVTLTNLYLGGGFGRRSNPDYAVQSARIAQQVSYPVKLIWSREEDTQQDHYRPAVLSRFKAGLDDNGKPIAWENQFVDKRDPVEASHIPYDIANQFIHFADSKTHVPWGAWRSVDHTQHGFFTESFIDELAHAANADPWEYRRSLLENKPRELAVLDMAANKANWGTPLPQGHGRGIALQKSFNSIVAQVVEVSIAQSKLRVERVVCAVDAGFAITPDGLIAQMESGIIYGLTAALYGEITIHRGAVAQSNFSDYEILRYDESPLIETHIINSGAPLGGAGEPGTPAIAPALVNAIFAATGRRIRDLPVKNHDLGKTSAEARDIA